jgi:hypothetical protein
VFEINNFDEPISAQNTLERVKELKEKYNGQLYLLPD